MWLYHETILLLMDFYSWFFIVIQNASLNILICVSLSIWMIITIGWNYWVRDHMHFPLSQLLLDSPSKGCVLTIPPRVNDMFLFHKSYGWSILIGQLWFGNGLMGVCCLFFFRKHYFALFCFCNKNTLIYIS